jgi:hypothetical protein
MNTAALERSTGSVGRGQHVQLVRRGLRRHCVDATVLGGTLRAGAEHTDAVLELVVAVAGVSDRPITISSSSARSMHLTSEGVFQQRGRVPSLWLTVTAELDRQDLPELTGHGKVTVFGDLNLNPSAESN